MHRRRISFVAGITEELLDVNRGLFPEFFGATVGSFPNPSGQFRIDRRVVCQMTHESVDVRKDFGINAGGCRFGSHNLILKRDSLSELFQDMPCDGKAAVSPSIILGMNARLSTAVD